MLGGALPNEQVISAFKQFYQSRTAIETQIVFAVINQAFSEIEMEKVKLYSYFAKLFEEENVFERKETTGSWYLIQQNQQNLFESYQIIQKEDLTKFNLSKLTIYISPQSKVKCQMLDSVQQAIKQLHHNKYFEDVPKKRLHHLLRHAQFLKTNFNNNIYCEGDILLTGQNFIFLVKQGEFCLQKMKNHQNLMLCCFGAGQFFGHEELVADHTQKKRLFTVNCRSSIGIVLKISEDFFNVYLKKSCEDHLRSSLQKIRKFVGKHLQNVQINRQKNNFLLTQTMSSRKSVSMKANTFITDSKLLQSSRVMRHEINQKRTANQQKLPFISAKSLISVNNSNKNQKVEKIEMWNPQFQQEAKIMNKKLSLQRIRNKYLKDKKFGTRGEVLLNLIKNSWHLQRNKKKTLINN